MTILNESGTPDVLPPLHAANNLARRLPGVLVLVLGVRSEAFLVQSFPAPAPPGFRPSPRSPRVVFMVLDPAAVPAQGGIASKIVETAAGFRGLEAVFVVVGRSVAAMGLDVPFETRLAERRLDIPIQSLDPDEPHERPGVLSTDLEDRAVAALVRLCPERGSADLVSVSRREADGEDGKGRRARGPERRSGSGGFLGGFLGRSREDRDSSSASPVVLAGAMDSPGSRAELTAELERAGVRVAGTLPTDSLAGLPEIGEGTVFALLDPNLSHAAEVAEERGARVVRSLFPIGIDGTAKFLQDVVSEAGGNTSELGRARSVWQGLQGLRNRIRGKRIFFAGDTGFEVPLSRFFADAGAVVLEVGAPRLDRKMLSEELQALGPDIDVVESPDWRGQMSRIEKARPDVVIASHGLYGPLVARGNLCRVCTDLSHLGVHGYSGAGRVLSLLASSFDRAEDLDSSLNL